mgnify:CR=1 FL=1
MLHHADRIFIGGSDEGELSILQSEVTKMTLRLREQNDALKQEKAHLADSLADIAHQLRTPLTSLNLVLSLLANQPDAGGRKALLREAEELLTQMDWLLTSLLKLSRLDAGCSWLDVAWPLGLFGIGYAFCLNTATPLALRGVEGRSAAASSRTLNTVRYIFISLYVSSVSTVLAHMKTGFRFSMAEQVRDDSPGTAHTLDMWQRHFAETGGTAREIHASVDAVLQKAVALQSQVFSVDTFYLCTVIVGAAGVLFALFCLKSGQERKAAS